MKKNLTRFAFFAILSAIFSLNVSAQERRLLPIDEADKDASFRRFREKLIGAVEKHDAKYVLSVVDRNVKNGFGGEDGIANFKKQWKINSPKSELWDELLFALTHGGAFSKEGNIRLFTAPYVFSSFPEDLDAFEYSAIVGTDIRLHAAPGISSPTVGALSYSIVKADYQNSVKEQTDSEKYDWIKVETTDGKKGFVAARFVKSPIGYRAGFEKIRGQWKMTFFLAGD